MCGQENKYNLSPTIEDKDIYKTALDTRNFEISMFWQRSNYFLALNSALAIGFFNTQEKNPCYALLLAFFAFVVSLLWFHVCLGSKYWQSRWEECLAKIEKKIAPELGFFAADDSLKNADVQKNINDGNHTGRLRKWVDKKVIQKPSVSYNMILLSMLFMAGWVFLGAVKLSSCFASCSKLATPSTEVTSPR